MAAFFVHASIQSQTLSKTVDRFIDVQNGKTSRNVTNKKGKKKYQTAALQLQKTHTHTHRFLPELSFMNKH